jgi:transcriptional regulator of heat shock response
MQRLERLSTQINKALLENNSERLKDGEKVILALKIEPLTNSIAAILQDAKNFLSNPNEHQSCTLAGKIQVLQKSSESLLECLKDLDLPAVRPRWCDSCSSTTLV